PAGQAVRPDAQAHDPDRAGEDARPRGPHTPGPLTCTVAVFPAPERISVAVRLRLTRVGGKKDPVWRVVAADQRSPRDGRVIEIVGQYNPQTSPSTIVLNEERIR